LETLKIPHIRPDIPYIHGVLGLAWLIDNVSAIRLLMFLLLELRLRVQPMKNKNGSQWGSPKGGGTGRSVGVNQWGVGRYAVRPSVPSVSEKTVNNGNVNSS